MIALVIGAAAVILAIVMGFGNVLIKVPFVAVAAYKNDTAVFLFHQGGDRLYQNETVVLINNQPVPRSNISLVSASWPWAPGEFLQILSPSPPRSVSLVYKNGKDEVLLAYFDKFGSISGNFTNGSGYTWQNFFQGPNVSSPYPYSPVFYGAAPIPWVQGHNPGGAGLFFNGTTYVSIPNSPKLAPPTGIRVDTWVQWAIPPGTGNQWANIVTKGDSDGNMQYALQHSQNNNMFEFAVRTTNGRSYVQSSGGLTLQQGVWYHVVGSYSAATGRIELTVNGAPPAVTTQTGPFAPGNYDLHIGEGINSNRYFNGIISDVNVTAM